MPATRLLQLSQCRQTLVRLCQWVNFGQILDLSVLDGEPIWQSPAPAVLVDVRLDAETQPRQEIAATDFVLGAEITRLMALLDKIETGRITKIEVRAGLPRRATFEARSAEAVPTSQRN
jgi:hypothetical protein